MLRHARDVDGHRLYWLIWVLIAAIFTLVQVRQSLHGGRLALPPTFDDIGFMLEGQSRLQVFLDHGPAAALAELSQSAPHSPWSTYLAALAFLVLGLHEWAPAAANGLLILAVLLWFDRCGRDSPFRWRLVAGGALLTWPILGQAVENFRPDLAFGLVTAALAVFIVRDPWVDAGLKRHLWAGLGLALALLIKPTISPVTILIVGTALAAATLTDILRAPSPIGWRSIILSWVRCLGLGVALAAPYFALAMAHLSGYIYRNTFGELKDVWSPHLSAREQVLYYLSGEGGRMMLAHWLYLWLLLVVMAAARVAYRRDRSALTRVPAFAAVLLISYVSITVPAHKHPFLGTVLPSLLLFSAIEMMVYLMRDSASSTADRLVSADKVTAIGRWALVALLVVGVASYRWPSQLTAGGPLTPAENRQHRDLLETVYRDLRHTDGEETRVFFTQISAFLNPVLFEYRAGLDRLEGFSSHDLQLSRELSTLAHQLTLADHVIAFSAGNRNAFRWLPGSETQSEFLRRLQADPEFSLSGIYGTPNGGEVYLFTRATGFRGVRALAGVGPLEGPYPQWGLHTQVRWAMGPVTRFEFRLPVDSRVRVRWDVRSDFPDQSMTIKIDGREVGHHRFAESSVFEDQEAHLELTAGRHLVELEHSHWHTPSAQDNRPRAVLMRTFSVLPSLDATGIVVEEASEASDAPG